MALTAQRNPVLVAFGKTVWVSIDNKTSMLDNLPHDHISNIYWFKRLEEFRNPTSFTRIAFVKTLKDFIETKFGAILPYYPVLQVEIDDLHKRKMVNNVNGDVTLNGTVIGSVLYATTNKNVNPVYAATNTTGSKASPKNAFLASAGLVPRTASGRKSRAKAHQAPLLSQNDIDGSGSKPSAVKKNVTVDILAGIEIHKRAVVLHETIVKIVGYERQPLSGGDVMRAITEAMVGIYGL